MLHSATIAIKVKGGETQSLMLNYPSSIFHIMSNVFIPVNVILFYNAME